MLGLLGLLGLNLLLRLSLLQLTVLLSVVLLRLFPLLTLTALPLLLALLRLLVLALSVLRILSALRILRMRILTALSVLSVLTAMRVLRVLSILAAVSAVPLAVSMAAASAVIFTARAFLRYFLFLFVHKILLQSYLASPNVLTERGQLVLSDVTPNLFQFQKQRFCVLFDLFFHLFPAHLSKSSKVFHHVANVLRLVGKRSPKGYGRKVRAIRFR